MWSVLLLQMVYYHETGGPGGQGEQAKSAEEEAASRGLEARVAEIGDAPKVVIKLAVGWSPKWLKLHRKW